MTTAAELWGAEGQAPDMTLIESVGIGEIDAAARRLAGRAHRTPVMTSSRLDALMGTRVYLKCENFQRVGAFKFRGAFNALALVREAAGEGETPGVITYSSGNHAQAVAMSAAMLGIRAVIVMPRDAPATKLEATRAYLSCAPAGSRVVEYDPSEVAREQYGRELAAREGLELVPPYDDPRVIAGQGTVAREFYQQLAERRETIDELYVCCGGGGLLSGCATASRAVSAETRVIGVEPEAGDDGVRSFRDRVLRTVKHPDTIADGARTSYLGRYTLPIVLARVDEMRAVSDRDLASLVRFCLQAMKIVIEPSGVLGLAGLLRASRERHGAGREQPGAVGVVVSGGNIDPEGIAAVLGLASDLHASE
ncbi:MAG: pyridoxal-phosphate dependent enzyme [Planctomycetota bacterium]